MVKLLPDAAHSFTEAFLRMSAGFSFFGDLHPRRDPAEDRVPAVQSRTRLDHDVELAVGELGIPRIGHRHRPRRCFRRFLISGAPIGLPLPLPGPTSLPSACRATRIANLDQEILSARWKRRPL